MAPVTISLPKKLTEQLTFRHRLRTTSECKRVFNRDDEACNSSWSLDNTGQVAGVTTELRVAGRKYTVESDRQHTVTVAVTRRAGTGR